MIATRRAFTLVELLVVIGVVVLLLGLTISAITSAAAFGQRRATESTLRLLDMTVAEWELESGRSLSWWDQEYDDMSTWYTADVHGSTPETLIITEILEVVLRTESARSVFAQIDPELVYTYEAGVFPIWLDHPDERQQMNDRFDGGRTVLDAWGVPIYATHPGRPYRPSDAPSAPPSGGSIGSSGPKRDMDGTIQTYNEQRYGVSRDARVRFVSAGPDLQFGWLNHAEDAPTYAQALDNLVSAPVDPPRSTGSMY